MVGNTICSIPLYPIFNSTFFIKVKENQNYNNKIEIVYLLNLNLIFFQQNYVYRDMEQQEESTNKKPLTQDQIKELMSYPNYWRATLQKAAERGESIKETYEELKDFEAMM